MFKNHWWYRHAALPPAIGSKIYVIHLVYKVWMKLNGTDWLIEIDWKKGSLKRVEIFLENFLKVWQEKTCGRAAFLETLQAAIISLHKKVNFTRKVLQTYSEICIFVCDTIDSKLSVGSSLKTVLDEIQYIVNLYSFLSLCPHANPFFPKLSHLPPIPARTTFTTPPSRHISNSLAVYVFLEFEL